jgi:hypothetical protein
VRCNRAQCTLHYHITPGALLLLFNTRDFSPAIDVQYKDRSEFVAGLWWNCLASFGVGSLAPASLHQPAKLAQHAILTKFVFSRGGSLRSDPRLCKPNGRVHLL